MKEKLAEKTLDKIPAPTHGSITVWDTVTGGLGLRITANGARSFFQSYMIDGRERRVTLGSINELSLEQARTESKKLLGSVASGIDPVAARVQEQTEQEEAEEPTVASLCAAYLAEAPGHLRESSLYDATRMVNKIVLPKIGHLKLAEITKKDIAELHASLRGTPYQANRVRSLLVSMFNLGIERDLMKKNPAHGVKKFHEEKRRCDLDTEGVQKLREAIEAYPHAGPRNALLLMLLTGSREGEVLRAEWAEFDLARGTWHKSYLHTKQKRDEDVPLSLAARKLLESMHTKGATGPLFPGAKRKGKDGKVTGGDTRVSLTRAWRAVCRTAGFGEVRLVDGKRKDANGEPVKLVRFRPSLRHHDIRHVFCGQLASAGVPLLTIGKLVGHSQVQTTQRYAYLQDAALRDAASVFGAIFEGGKRPALPVDRHAALD